MTGAKQFDVALSFAGEDREYVQEVADELRSMGIKVFYDKYETVTLWGKDLFEYLQDIYRNKSTLTIMFCSANFAAKLWTNHERKAAQARAFEESKEYILPARFDNTEIPGILPTIGYVDLNEYTPAAFAELVKEKLGPQARVEFFPDTPDRLYEAVGAETAELEQRAHSVGRAFFESLKLMTPEERKLLVTVANHGCPAGHLEDNMHINIEYLSRLTRKSGDEITAALARLDCLGIETKVREEEDEKDSLSGSKMVLVVEFKPLRDDVLGTGTDVADAMLTILAQHFCEEHAHEAMDNLDFSILSTKTGFSELREEG